MRNIIVIITFICFGFVAYAQSSLTDTYKDAVSECYLNEAEAILFGDISALSDKSLLDIVSLSRLNGNSYFLLRNMIYARHGNIFNSQDLTSYFSQFSWYKPKEKIDDKYLNDTERQNIEIIQTFENMDEHCESIILGPEKEGIWQQGFGFTSGWGNRFVIYSNDEIEFIYSQMRQMPIIKRLAGTYKIKGNVLVFKVSEIDYYEHDQKVELSGGFGYQWLDGSDNTIIFKNSIVLKFPITELKNEVTYDMLNIYSMMIGGLRFFRMEKDVNRKY